MYLVANNITIDIKRKKKNKERGSKESEFVEKQIRQRKDWRR